jgi:pyruvate dehydrogenase E1 component alpha subunit
MKWHYIDGNDLLQVYQTMRQAVNDVRQGNGPVFVETETYRYFGHSKSDRNLYRTKEEIEKWRGLDPINRVRSAIVEAGIVTDDQAEEIDQKALKEIEAAVEFAENSPEPDVNTVEEFVYA